MCKVCDEAPEQGFSFVGELRAVGCDLLDEGIEDRVKSREGFGFVPDRSGVRIALGGAAAEILEVVANDRGG